MQFKKILALLLTIVYLCTAFSTSAYADTVSSISSTIAPAYEMAGNVKGYLSVAGTTATCISQTYGDETVVSITVEQTLQKHRWLGIWTKYDDASWTSTVNSNYIYMSNTKSGLESGKYRLKSVFKLTNSAGKTEEITTYSLEVEVG